MEELEKKLKNFGLDEKKIAEIIKKKKLAERVKFVLDESKVDKCEKEVGNMLISIAEKLNPAYNHRLPVLIKYVLNKDISTTHQLDFAIDFLKKKGEENVTEDEFKEKCGIGLKISEDDIKKELNEIIKTYEEKLKKERYKFQTVKILSELRKKFTFVDPKQKKSLMKKLIKFLEEKIKMKLKKKNLEKNLIL